MADEKKIPNLTRFAKQFECGDFLKHPKTGIYVGTKLLWAREPQKTVEITTVHGELLTFDRHDLLEYQSRKADLSA